MSGPFVADRVADPWGPRTPYGPGGAWPVRVDQHLAAGLAETDVERWVPTASVLHSNGDGIDLAVREGRIVGVRGRAADRVNRGRLDPKDVYGWQANASPDRLTRPLVRDGGRLRPASWDEAMGRAVGAVRAALAEPHGHNRVGFYTSGQLFLEEYYALAVLGKAGIGTPHMDGNTRLCTATAAAALKESFGSDGQPASYTDVDHCDALALWGHDVAATQAVLWMRILDRRAGPRPPTLLCVDPRTTAVAAEADLHLAIRSGTNLALLNALVHEVIAHGWVDRAWVDAHTLGYDALAAVAERHPPSLAAEVCDVDVGRVRAAAELVGTSERLLSTVLQGVYQSHQATASACTVDDLHLLRGMIGRPGCGVLQMNGQPTAQNTRETGADGDLPGFRNWDDPDHIRQLAELWDVDPMVIPHWAPPTHALQIFRYAETGSIDVLWISGTNPAVSLPDVARVHEVLADEGVFVVVQDIFPTETTALADVVLPAAAWGEKEGAFTNVDRTVHLSEKAVEPPGEARSDLAIFLDLARRLDLRTRTGRPLLDWSSSAEAFDAWAACSAGRPCDYSGLSHDRLRGAGGIQWPVTAEAPDGTERLYVDAVFPTDPGVTEDFGHDLVTGATTPPDHVRALRPDGRAHLRGTDYAPSPEEPSDEWPLRLATGRTLTQFHTRTKTGRAPELAAAAPEPWVEIHPDDAVACGLAEGDRARVTSPRGWFEAPVRVGGTRPGVVFVPFHYGWWDDDARRHGAANRLTATRWDPVSKQPSFKLAAVRVAPAGGAP